MLIYKKKWKSIFEKSEPLPQQIDYEIPYNETIELLKQYHQQQEKEQVSVDDNLNEYLDLKHLTPKQVRYKTKKKKKVSLTKNKEEIEYNNAELIESSIEQTEKKEPHTEELSVNNNNNVKPGFTYAQRIENWFDDIWLAEEDKSFNDILYHSFSKETDRYLVSIGIQTPYHNKSYQNAVDTMYQLAGEIVFPNGERKLVIFHITVDSKGTCYHRGLELKEGSELFDEYFAQNYWKAFHHEDNFPKLGQSLRTYPKIHKYLKA